MVKKITEELENLRSFKEKHGELFEKLYMADDRNIYFLDLFILSALNRSLCLIRGFCDLIESRNYTCAAPLIRLQLDNCLRIYAPSLSEDPQEFSLHVLQGEHVNNLKNKDGQRLTDNYLSKSLSIKYPWIKETYKITSGYIHLSEQHFLSTIEPNQNDSDLKYFKLSSSDEHLPEEIFSKAVGAFIASTKLLLHIITQWICHKELKGKAGLSE